MKENKKEKAVLVLTALLLTLGVTGCSVIDSVFPSGSGTGSATAAPAGETEIEGTEINLDTCEEQLVIREAGEYILTGSTKYGVAADPGSGTVILHLNNASISNSESAGIIGESGDALVIDLMDGTSNSVSDGGEDEDHDGAVFGNIPLVFRGSGSLSVKGNAGEGISTKSAPITFEGGTYEIVSADDGINTGGDGGTITFSGGTFRINASGDGIDSNTDILFDGADVLVTGSAAGGDAGIDSENGYRINGGTVIALGSDMLEVPQDASAQKSLALTLDSVQAEGSKVELLTEKGKTIVSFTADQAFRTLVISSADLKEGNYSLTVDGQTASIGGETVFAVKGTVSSYGNDIPWLPGQNGMPQMPGQDGQNGQPPQFPGQDGQNGQPPQFPGQDGQNGQPPQFPGQDGQNGQSPQFPGQDGQGGQPPQFPGQDGQNGQPPQMPGQSQTPSN